MNRYSFCFLIITGLFIRYSFLCSQTVIPHLVPEEFLGLKYKVTVNGTPVPVFHAGLNVYYASFEFTGNPEVIVTADKESIPLAGNAKYAGQVKHISTAPKAGNFWEDNAIVRPLSKKIQVHTDGKNATFIINEPGQYSVERPGTSNYLDQVIFLFANPVKDYGILNQSDNKLIYLEPGIHHRNIDLATGQTLYLAPGAVLFGAINVWEAKDVRILGKGVVVYNGPQSELRDNGYLHRKNWHPLTTYQTDGLEVDGVTFVGRSRTWSIQLHTTFNSIFNNVKVLSVNPQNINGDGFDWYAGGNSRVTNCLIRASDDCFAFFVPPTESEVFEHQFDSAMVSNILIENCVLWTTLANVYRIGFGAQKLKTDNIHMLNTDVIHIGKGEWMAPWSIVHTMGTGIGGKAVHTNYLFENIRFEEATAFIGVQNREVIFKDIVFRNVSMIGEPVPSFNLGKMDGVLFENVTLNGKKITSAAEIPMREGSIDINNLKFK